MISKFRELTIILILICIVSFVEGCSKKKEVLPERVNDLILVKTISGEEAKTTLINFIFNLSLIMKI